MHAVLCILQLSARCYAGIGHGVRRSMVSLGSVLGSLWAAAALQLKSNTLLYGGPIGLVVLCTVSSCSI